ncbi:hypothetical protein [Photobacterium angustum]|uniref:hypothetical protein n=1 Tax=Photobacterium angustum TaxID=661 RepID=UPI0005E12B49|nr:hypothetical protein [Photobacterium angustum]KJG00097.1 hypothetical protein UB35_19790 [Photobacterium angustum]PSV61697.1 hypothetical protein CTM95_20560 [Photobacterium angustum]
MKKILLAAALLGSLSAQADTISCKFTDVYRDYYVTNSHTVKREPQSLDIVNGETTSNTEDPYEKYKFLSSIWTPSIYAAQFYFNGDQGQILTIEADRDSKTGHVNGLFDAVLVSVMRDASVYGTSTKVGHCYMSGQFNETK